MKIDDCYKCGEPVKEDTKWDVSVWEGFLCEECNLRNQLSDEDYRANAAWLKSLSKKGDK